MNWIKINNVTYDSKCNTIQIYKTETGWKYRFKGYIEGMILTSRYSFKNARSIKDALDLQDDLHRMVQLETNKGYLVITEDEKIVEVKPDEC